MADILTLSVMQLVILYLFHQGTTQIEIARQTGFNYNSVKTTIRRHHLTKIVKDDLLNAILILKYQVTGESTKVSSEPQVVGVKVSVEPEVITHKVSSEPLVFEQEIPPFSTNKVSLEPQTETIIENDVNYLDQPINTSLGYQELLGELKVRGLVKGSKQKISRLRAIASKYNSDNFI